MHHGLWSPGVGLLLWRDDNDTADDVTSPPEGSLAALFALGRFRHKVTVEDTVIPAIGCAPAAAVEVLLGTDGDAGLAGDFRYLRHVARGLRRWVAAGRVVPEVYRADGQWWTRWRLVGGERQRAWLAELAAAMPSVQRGVGLTPDRVLADLVTELVDPMTRTRIDPAHGATHPLVESLITGEELIGGTHGLATQLERWRGSLTADEPELVLRLCEPDDADDDDVDDEALWRLEVLLQAEGEAPQPVSTRSADPSRVRMGIAKLGAAMEAYPRLRDVPTDTATLDLLLPTEVVIDLVTHGAPALQGHGVSLLLPRAWQVAAPSLRLSVTAPAVVGATESAVGMNELVAYNWQLAVGDMVLTTQEMARLADSKSDLVRLRGNWVQADHAALAKAARYIAGQRDEAALGALLGELGAGAPPIPVAEVAASGWIETLLNVSRHPAEVPAPAGLKATLRPYQRRGLDWLAFMSAAGLGAVLADDMGLGKTVQVLALLAHEDATDPTLLVAPMSVVGNWQREAERFTPDLRVHVHHGAARLGGDELAAAVAASDLVVTTYSLLAKDLEQLREMTWERVILDEAQHIKNAATAQSRAARAVPARHRLALTGTPVENRLEEFRSILDFANRNLLGTPHTFRARFAVPIERDRDPEATARLQAITSPFVLRRVKTDPAVISDLPEKFEMTVRANLTAEQASLYQAVVDDMLRKIAGTDGMKRKGAVLAALTRLKQVCNHPAHFLSDGSGVTRRGKHRSGKLGLVEDILDSVLADGERALLFTQFREFGELVGPYLAERFGVETPFLHGGVPKQRRDTMVTRFQEQDGPPLMLLSLKAGGTGLTLTAANHVVHLDRWWNPAVENQATDRAFRIGQQRNVQVRKLICVGTVEERIDAMITSKKELAALAVGAGENWITELDTDALAELLRLGDDAVGE